MLPSKGQDTLTTAASKPVTKTSDSDKYASIASEKSIEPSTNYDDEFDDFDPRGTATASKYCKIVLTPTVLVCI